MTVRVAVIAWPAGLRSALEAVLKAVADFRVVDAAESPPAPVARDRADVLVLAVSDDRVDHEVRVQGRRRRGPALVVLADRRWRSPAREWAAAVRAVLPRDATPAELAAAVHAAAAGLLVVHPAAEWTVRARAARASGEPPAIAAEALTAREIEVLGMMAEGLGNKAIAARLGLSGHTVKFHVASILGKLGATSRTEAVTLGIRQGLIVV